MSNDVNTILCERAAEQMEYWAGTMWERIIQRDLDTDDWEALRYHVVLAEKEMALQEDYPTPEHEQERAERILDEMRENGNVF